MSKQNAVLTPLSEEKTMYDLLKNHKGYSEDQLQEFLYQMREAKLKEHLKVTREIYTDSAFNPELQENIAELYPPILKDEYFWNDPSFPWNRMSWEQMTNIPITDQSYRQFIEDSNHEDNVMFATELIENILNVSQEPLAVIKILLSSILHLEFLAKYEADDAKKWLVKTAKFQDKIVKFKPNRKSKSAKFLKRFEGLKVTDFKIDMEQYMLMIASFFENLEEIKNMYAEKDFPKFLNQLFKSTLTLADMVRNQNTSFLDVVSQLNIYEFDEIIAEEVETLYEL